LLPVTPTGIGKGAPVTCLLEMAKLGK